MAEMRETKGEYNRADREEAEAYWEYMDVVERKNALADMRDPFARTLDGEAVEEYERRFEARCRKRWRWLGSRTTP